MDTHPPAYRFPAPLLDPATEPFWQAAKAGAFALRRCTQCARFHWYPRPICPFCMGDTAWTQASGTGVLYSVTVTRRAGPVPYALAYVTLDEGVTVLTHVVDGDLDALRIGQRVQVTFADAEGGWKVPVFRPTGG